MSGLGLVDVVERRTLCVSTSIPGIVAHDGDEKFLHTLQKHFNPAENNAAEQLVILKTRLEAAVGEDFWSILMDGMTDITGAQYAFVTKRILVDDQNSAVEMPPMGEPGSCLVAVAFLYNDGRQIRDLYRDYKYLAYGAPCSHMRHDKVFMVPEGLSAFVPDNPNPMHPTDAYLGIPLFSKGKCFAHFGTMWTTEGLKKKRLGWGYLEMLLHSLEDAILNRLIKGQGFGKPSEAQENDLVIPQDAITAFQSLKPYARSLSHELRTPMQGVVGMLDVMHATVQESLECQSNSDVRETFRSLCSNIEVVQDSSRRAIEAADNVVHAYDLDMQVSGTPAPLEEEEVPDPHAISDLNLLTESNGISTGSKKKRRIDSVEQNFGPRKKRQAVNIASSSSDKALSHPLTAVQAALHRQHESTDAHLKGQETKQRADLATQPSLDLSHAKDADASTTEPTATLGLRYSRIRSLLQHTINESLRVGERPDSAIAQDTDHGETIEVRARSSKGDPTIKLVEWLVDDSVPDIVLIDDRDLAKLLSCVLLNAIKFTENGKITITATLSQKSRFIVIAIRDTGPGIPQAFLPSLFRPFSREDDSLTRRTEGLGLGLLVAKGLARKIGGDLVCVRSETSGPARGSEFELRVPVSQSDSSSRPITPLRTPTPESLNGISTSNSSLRGDLIDRRFSTPAIMPTSSKTPEPPFLIKATSTLLPSSPSRRNSISQVVPSPTRTDSGKKALPYDRSLGAKFPLTFLIAEDNKINRKLLFNMLSKLGYTTIYEAYDGAEAVRQMAIDRAARDEKEVDVILMDLWMPGIDGYAATEEILAMDKFKYAERHRTSPMLDHEIKSRKPTIIAVSADVTDEALERAKTVGMVGFMTKPYMLADLQRLIVEYCTHGHNTNL